MMSLSRERTSSATTAMVVAVLMFLNILASTSVHVADAFVAKPSLNTAAFAVGRQHSKNKSSKDSSTSSQRRLQQQQQTTRRGRTSLRMVDMVTYLRTEWVAAALFTNQTPRAADVCLQLGTEDGRAITFLPRTIRELVTSSAEADGTLSVSCRRQLKQQQERREAAGPAAKVTYCDQRADDLKDVKDESVDVVISLLAAEKMIQNGLDWKKSIREAARVLKPGGRLLFVEKEDLEGDNYVDYVGTLLSLDGALVEPEDVDEIQRVPIYEIIGWDPIDMCPTPHVAGVAMKSENAGLTPEQRAARKAQEEQEKLAELSLKAFERGSKKRKRVKKSKSTETAEEQATTK